MMHGVVLSGTGGNVLPLNQARVTLFDVASGWPALVSEAKTDRSGAFTLETPSSDGLFYTTANLGHGIVLMALVGPTPPAFLTIDELTTVTAVYCAAPFIERRKLEGDPAGLRAAMEKCASLEPDRAMRSLANVLASCVRDPKAARDRFFDLATPIGGRRPSDTISALHNVARNAALGAAIVQETNVQR